MAKPVDKQIIELDPGSNASLTDLFATQTAAGGLGSMLKYTFLSYGTLLLDTDPRIPTQGENDALAGTIGTPSSANPYVTKSDVGDGVQPFNDGLFSIAGLITAADKMIFTTALDTYAVTDLTAFARSLLDDADAATARATLGAAATVHVHAAADITTGEFADARISKTSVTQHVASIDHNALLNFTITEHRTIDDAGTSTVDLLSASKIIALISAAAGTDNNFVFAHDTTIQAISIANTFQDLTFATDNEIDGWTHGSGADFTCNQTGRYSVTLDLNIEKTSGGSAGFGWRALFNALEVTGSASGIDVATNNLNIQISKSIIVNATTGQILKLQIAGSTTNIQLSPGPNPGSATTNPSATIKIERIT